jgi:hypothetical protein
MRLPNANDPPPLVDPGEYDLAYVGHQTSRVFGTPKLVMYFRIVTQGPAFDRLLPRWYRVRSVSSSKRFRFGWHGELVREFAVLFNERPTHADRFPVGKFKDVMLVGRVATVGSDHKQRDIPEPLRYSVIRELLRIKS